MKRPNLVLMTSAGHLLSVPAKPKRNGLAAALRKVLAEYAKLPQSDRFPEEIEGEEKPVPAPPPGGLVLTIYDRPLGSADGHYRLPQGHDLGGLRTYAPGGQRSSLWLTREECQSLVPANPRKGQSQPVAEKLAKRIWLYGLWPQTLWVVSHRWQPDSVRETELQITVLEVSEKSLRLRIHGSAVLAAMSRLLDYRTRKVVKALENRYDARLEGTLVYDKTQKKIVQWNMVALGDYTGVMFTNREENGRQVERAQWREATPQSPVPLGFSFELDPTTETAPEYRRPRSFVHAFIFKNREPYYWDPEKWEQDSKKRPQRQKQRRTP